MEVNIKNWQIWKVVNTLRGPLPAKSAQIKNDYLPLGWYSLQLLFIATTLGVQLAERSVTFMMMSLGIFWIFLSSPKTNSYNSSTGKNGDAK